VINHTLTRKLRVGVHTRTTGLVVNGNTKGFGMTSTDKWDDVGCVKEYLSACPYAEFTQIDDIYDDGDVYVLTVGMAVRKEDLEND